MTTGHFKETDIFMHIATELLEIQMRFLNWEHGLSNTVIHKKVLHISTYFFSFHLQVSSFCSLEQFCGLSQSSQPHSRDPDESKIIFFQAASELEKDLVFFNEWENNTLFCKSFLPKQTVTISLSIPTVQIFPEFQQCPLSFIHHSMEHDL